MRLVLAVHGTASPSGQQVYRDLAARTAENVPTALAHLDVQTFTLDDVVREGDVVVPVLLARGYHVRVDCAAAVQHGAVVAPALGPDPALIALADRRLRGTSVDVAFASPPRADRTAGRRRDLAARTRPLLPAPSPRAAPMPSALHSAQTTPSSRSSCAAGPTRVVVSPRVASRSARKLAVAPPDEPLVGVARPAGDRFGAVPG